MSISKSVRFISLSVLKPVLRANRYISEKGVMQHKAFSAPVFVGFCLVLSLMLQSALNASPLKGGASFSEQAVKTEQVAMNFPRVDVNDRKLADLIAFQPEKINTVEGVVLLSAFEAPSLHKKEGVFEILQYQSEMCVADFYFKHGKEKDLNSAKLASVVFHTRDSVIAEKETVFAQSLKAKGEKRDCLNSILKKDKAPGFFKFASADILRSL